MTDQWDDLFENTPTGEDPGTVIPASFKNLKRAIRERLELEHIAGTPSPDSHGVHKEGSARAFVDDAAISNYAPRLPVPLNDNRGKLIYRPTARTMEVHNGDSVAELAYVHTGDVADSIDGVKTFAHAPIITEEQLNGSEMVGGYDTTKAAKIDFVEARILEQVGDAIDTLTATLYGPSGMIPVGFLYTQYPGMLAPADLWSSLKQAGGVQNATWQDITEINGSWGSAFTRLGPTVTTAGITDQAGSFVGAAVQDAALTPHTHTYSRTTDALGAFPGTMDVSNDSPDSVQTSSLVSTPAHVGISAEGDLRPRNITVKVWKRTA